MHTVLVGQMYNVACREPLLALRLLGRGAQPQVSMWGTVRCLQQHHSLRLRM